MALAEHQPSDLRKRSPCEPASGASTDFLASQSSPRRTNTVRLYLMKSQTRALEPGNDAIYGVVAGPTIEIFLARDLTSRKATWQASWNGTSSLTSDRWPRTAIQKCPGLVARGRIGGRRPKLTPTNWLPGRRARAHHGRDRRDRGLLTCVPGPPQTIHTTASGDSAPPRPSPTASRPPEPPNK